MGFLHRSSVCALALVAGAAALQIEPVVLRDLVVEGSGHRVSIGAIRAPLWSAAFAQSADTFSLENVAVTFGPATYLAKTINFSGVATPRAEIEALFSSTSTEPMAGRLARITARQISIPDLKVQQKLGNKTETITYKNVTLTDIAQGRIAQAAASATGAEIAEGKDRTLFSYGRITVSDLDVPAFAQLYETKAEAASGPLTKIYGAFSIDNVEVVSGNGDTDIKIARMNGRDFMARATRDSWAGTLTLFSELSDKDKLSGDDEKRLVATVADFFSAFDIGFVEATDFELKARPKDHASPMTSRIKRMAYTSGTGAQPSDARIEGLEVTDQDGRVGIGSISFTGFSFAPMLDGLKALEGKSLKDLDATVIRSLVPTIGTMRVTGIDIDTLSKDGKPNNPNPKPPIPKNPDAKPERIKAGLKEFEITADKPVNAVPTNIRIGMKNFAMALPENSKDEGIQNLTDLGYRTIDLSLLVATNWNEATQELAIQEISLQGQNMGRLSLTGLLGNVSKDAFNPDTAIASVALISAKAKSVDLTLDNGGLFERFLDKTAKEQKTTPEALRRTYATAAAMVIPSMIGNSEQAKTLSQAVSRFIAKPGRIVINARAKDSAGLGVADIAVLSEPTAILEKLNVTAKTE
ncbi:hypothetical protein [Microvirga sp. 2TAF3]|uniref:hypothetical protein n=1 Tax=Microvirga sp. 2TAF3 TaxID=3233014 RepID=UPI003F9D5EC0